MATETQAFPARVEAFIVRRGNGIAVMDSAQPSAKPLDSILVHYDGEIVWNCELGPWEVLRKEGGQNAFKNGNGVRGKKGEHRKVTPVCGRSPHIVVCGYSVAVWDEAAQELFLRDPDIVVGPPGGG